LITPFSTYRCLYPFWRYSRLNCEIARNHAKFWTIFAFPNSKAIPPKLYPRYYARLAVRHVEKIREVTPQGHKVITANTPNFMPIFECSLLKIVGGTPVPNGVCAKKPWSFSSVCKYLSWQRPLGAEIWSSKKS